MISDKDSPTLLTWLEYNKWQTLSLFSDEQKEMLGSIHGLPLMLRYFIIPTNKQISEMLETKQYALLSDFISRAFSLTKENFKTIFDSGQKQLIITLLKFTVVGSDEYLWPYKNDYDIIKAFAIHGCFSQKFAEAVLQDNPPAEIAKLIKKRLLYR